MDSPTTAWEEELARLWAGLDNFEDSEFVSRMAALTAQLAAGNPVGLFERAAAWDSTGRSDFAVPLYEEAIASGLSGIRRRRAVIQMASSLRNLGQVERAASMLEVELLNPPDELTQAVQAFLALALADLGREREGLALSLDALSHYLPRYNRSLARYAKALVSEGS